MRSTISVKGVAVFSLKVDGVLYVEGTEVEGEMPKRTSVIDVIGDGKAKVSAGVGMGTSREFGRRKYDAWTSVQLTCNQSGAKIRKAHELAGLYAVGLCEELLDVVDAAATERFPLEDEK